MRKTVELSGLKPNSALRFLYGTVLGRMILQLLIRPGVSGAVGAFLSTGLSRALIPGFVKRNGIDLSRYQGMPYGSYNAFFSREIRPENLHIGQGLIAPCDSRLSVYPIDENAVFTVKGSPYSLEEILGKKELAAEFVGGTCLIFRLEVQDYHRYCYFDRCRETEHWVIPGVLHTVQPVAFDRYPVYHRNSREITVLQTEHYGKAVQIEVGALCVGRIANHHGAGVHERGEEKGMFLFGGSTVMLLVKGAAIDAELMENTARNRETLVTIGEQIGR